MCNDNVGRCGDRTPGYLFPVVLSCDAPSGHVGPHRTVTHAGRVLTWANRDPVPPDVVAAAKSAFRPDPTDYAWAAAFAPPDPFYWFKLGGLWHLPSIHAPGCVDYGQGRGAYITVEQRPEVDPRSRARDCKRCGGMWADIWTEA